MKSLQISKWSGITIWLILGVLVFSVCILNQFVAIFNEGYSAAEKAWFMTFLQEKAKACLRSTRKDKGHPTAQLPTQTLEWVCVCAQATSL